MQRKIILANKSKVKGVAGDDSDDLTKYFELGWELAVTRLKAIKLLANGDIDKDDIIVTVEDRKFLYTKHFNNVITYNRFLSYDGYQVFDLVDLSLDILKSTMYRNLIQTNLKEILDVDYSDLEGYKIDEPFICMLIRFRDHCSYRSCDINYSKDLLKGLIDNGFRVFLGGKGNFDQFPNTDRCQYVPKLRDWASLVNHKNCLAVTGPTSGASSMLGQTCSAASSKILVMDPDKISMIGEFGTHPLFFGRGVNFTNVPVRFYCQYPTTEQLIHDIMNWQFRLGTV